MILYWCVNLKLAVGLLQTACEKVFERATFRTLLPTAHPYILVKASLSHIG